MKQTIAHLAHPNNESRATGMFTRQFKARCGVFASRFRVEGCPSTYQWTLCPKCAAATLIHEVTEANRV